MSFAIGVFVGAMFGLLVAIIINYSWYKDTIKMNDEWFNICNEIIRDMSNGGDKE